MTANEVFVFGSNLAGIHGAGAAKVALAKHGATWGRGTGLMGASYALATKDERVRTLPIGEVQRHVERFIRFAESRPDLRFKVTQVGCGLAGLTPAQVAPMFMGAPGNCTFDSAWRPWLGDAVAYWGTYP